MTTTSHCRGCSANFEISARDIKFYHRISPLIGGQLLSIPPPTLCPDCRQQRLLSYRNERNFYRRRCDLTGKNIISTYAPGTPLTVYEHKNWLTDQWNPGDFGRDFDFSRNFFEQFFALHEQVPLMSLDVKSSNENCDFCNLISGSRNCYFAIACIGEDCLYSTFVQRNRSITDCFFIFDSELCYECIDCYNCYELLYSQFCEQCSTSRYLYNCRSCSDCLYCVGLTGQHCSILNQQYSPDEYKSLAEKLLSDPKFQRETAERFETLKASQPEKYYSGTHNENVIGDHLSHCKNVYSCFDCTGLEDCSYCIWFHKSNDCYDCYGWGIGGELGYESHLIGSSFQRLLFCESCWGSVSDLLYCRYCQDNSHHLFGCVGLRGREYCILNKQYTRDAYEELVPRIVAHMKSTGEWGEFFPSSYSPYSYHETVAHDYFPLSEEKARKREFHWRNDPPSSSPVGRHATAKAIDAHQVPDSIIEEVFNCSSCVRSFRLISSELKFYRQLNLPLPDRCFHCRHAARLMKRNTRRLSTQTCVHCGKQVLSTFKPEDCARLYCEECYLQTQK